MGGNVVLAAMPFFAGVRSPPLRRIGHPSWDGLPGKTRDNVGAGFLGGTHSVRPRGNAAREPRHFIPPRASTRARGLRGTCFGQARAFLAGVQSPPLRGGRGGGEVALRGRPGDDAEGGLLGGTHSVRPHCKAGCEPGHNMIIGGKRIPGGQMGTCSGEANSVIAGVRSPPLRGGAKRGKRPIGERPEMMPRAVFSEGRTLCVRVARPDASRGTA